jgi:hypothetical protein
MEQPRLDSQVLVLKELYVGMVGRGVGFETQRSSLVVRLEVANWEVTISKYGVIQAVGMHDGL